MSSAEPFDPLFLGIDTGGTYTDAVLWSRTRGVVAKAKALTTRYDLAVGVGGAVDAILAKSGMAPETIKLASMSTTLATNALVEGQGERAALVLIGFDAADVSRSGLKAALGADPVIHCAGGHDAHGQARELRLDDLRAALPELARDVSAFAVCGLFAVRNPEHEIAVRDLIRSTTALPVTASHELSTKLDGPKRALTTLLNARLISMIDRLIAATEGFLARRGIAAPLMVVRGDGALVSAAFARSRPIETILSGPAASLIGAKYMTGLPNAVVADIGGTTTDVAILSDGRPRLDPDGAFVGGYRTMVEAVAMRTFGLGGDSEVAFATVGLDNRIALGPRRFVPLSLAAALHGEAVLGPLERQSRAAATPAEAGLFAMRAGLPDRLAAGLSASDARLYARLNMEPQPLDGLIASSAQRFALDRLVARGLAQVVGFTPSDAAHVVGRQSNWNAEAARLGAELFARRKNGRGQTIAASGVELAERVLRTLTRRSAEAMLETAFAEDGFDGAATAAHGLVQRSLDGFKGVARVTVALDRPVIGLGASAALHYAGLSALVGNSCITPGDADVANALGAVVGQVHVRAQGAITQPVEGHFRVVVGERVQTFSSENAALEAAEAWARESAARCADAAGAAEVEIAIERELRVAVVEGRRMFVDAEIVAVAAGRPRIGVSKP